MHAFAVGKDRQTQTRCNQPAVRELLPTDFAQRAQRWTREKFLSLNATKGEVIVAKDQFGARLLLQRTKLWTAALHYVTALRFEVKDQVR